MAIVIRDEFTDTDGTLLTAHAIAPVNTPLAAWTALSGGAAIYSNRAQRAATTDINVVDALVSDCVVSVNLIITAGASAAIAYRVTDVNNWWMVRIINAGMDIYEFTASVLTMRATVAHTYNSGTSYPMVLTLDGAVATVLCDGATITYTSGVRQLVTNHGLRFSTAACYADNFQIEIAGNPSPLPIAEYYKRRIITE